MMNSIDVLRQYVLNNMDAKACIEELKQNISQPSGISHRVDIAKTRYIMGFVRRYQQYRHDYISGQDLCLNLRDLLLITGRLQVSNRLYKAVQTYGESFQLISERDNWISTYLQIPAWATPATFIEDVYALKEETHETSPMSIGDAWISSVTKFQGYKSYEQKMAVHSALFMPRGNTLLVSLPTGGGKSLITQMLAAHSSGLTIVVVPTVALALDQFGAAQSNLLQSDGIYCYRGDQNAQEKYAIIKAIQKREAKLLFTSPEAILKNSDLATILSQAAADKYLENVVVDEAHIVPDWGTFFRPDFQIFSIVLKEWRVAGEQTLKTVLLSATLSDDVVDTLLALFGEEGRNIQVRCDALRYEPKFVFSPVKSPKVQMEQVISALKYLPKPMVIYVLEPREAKELQSKLQAKGYKNIPIFSGETKDAERDRILKDWKNQDFDVVIGTSAFGIGVDKADVRTIVHACAPENLSRFYQEVGRGGRDGLSSLSVLIPYQGTQAGEGDLHRAHGLVSKRVLRPESIVNRWFAMLEHPSAFIDGDMATLYTSATPPTMSYEEAEYAGNRNMSWNINLLLMLHRTGFIKITKAQYELQQKVYVMALQVLKPEVLNSPEMLLSEVTDPREHEMDLQLAGYYALRKLVQKPTATCWGKSFKRLYPLSREVCNGCPVHATPQITIDATYKLREKPEITLPVAEQSKQLKRRMGAYSDLVVLPVDGRCFDFEELADLFDRAAKAEIGCLVIPEPWTCTREYPGLVLTYSEFHETVKQAPYLFHKGVLCVFDHDTKHQSSLLYSMEKLAQLYYRRVFYGSDDMRLPSIGKSLADALDGYRIHVSQL